MLARHTALTRPVIITGMFGIGDNIHQRAVIREAMKAREVYLETRTVATFADLEGLHIIPAQKPRRIREATPVRLPRAVLPKNDVQRVRLTYDAKGINRCGSILGAMFESAGLDMPERPDFSIPVKPEWRAAARSVVGRQPKPLMVLRPIVLNEVWKCEERAPDPASYDALYRSIRDRFYVVSVADLKQREWIVGEEQIADRKLHRGELDLETMLGLYAEASLVFGTPGSAGVIAQAVGTPSIIVYGGNECHRTTNAVGEHLAPTLAIEPVNPCDCHRGQEGCPNVCDKRIDLVPALDRVSKFADQVIASPKAETPSDVVVPFRPRPKVLIFGTTYVDTQERLRLTKQWAGLHRQINPECDFLLVDSASPLKIDTDTEVSSFADNIGHLSRGGRDGWGRAFCEGLRIAVERGYDYAVHIEGDSLFKLPVMPIVQEMQANGMKVCSVPVEGTKRKEVGWVETGLMFFDVGYLKASAFIAKYDWPNRTERPTPEKVIFNILGSDLKVMPWKAERGDKSQITAANVTGFDWVTHCQDNPEVYDKFVRAFSDVSDEPDALIKLNFGCGKNKLPGWANYDQEVDIAKPLPFADGYADFILAEHVVEHVPYKAAYAFLRECRRVLRAGGVLRIAVPSIEQVIAQAENDYVAFTKRWAPEGGKRGAVRSLIEAHGHECGWNVGLLKSTLWAAGFDTVTPCEVSKSSHPDLRGVEGHHKIIGEKFNRLETIVCEAS